MKYCVRIESVEQPKPSCSLVYILSCFYDVALRRGKESHVSVNQESCARVHVLDTDETQNSASNKGFEHLKGDLAKTLPC